LFLWNIPIADYAFFKNFSRTQLLLGLVIFDFVVLLASSYYMWAKRARQLVTILLPAIIIISSLSIATDYLFNNVLKPHQQDRINVWLKPSECDPRKSLYNIIQSKTAIGSGGIAGKGYLQGTMTELDHVPEQTTDFIFSIVGEEQGFLGVLSIILLFGILIYRIVTTGEKAKNLFIRRYAYAIAGILFFHVFINIGMTMGICPVIGIPLPFLSKGGTALLFFSIMIGILVKMEHSRL
jgi:rod shape determining protein RodA